MRKANSPGQTNPLAECKIEIDSGRRCKGIKLIKISTVRQLALSLPEVEEQDHFGRPSFRIKRKIFATIHLVEKRVVLKLSAVDQSVFTEYNNKVFYPVKGAWGKQGWTMVELKKVRKDMFKDALNTAWREVAPKRILLKYLDS